MSNIYFSHDSNARNDDKILALRMKHGWEGYGLYWAIVEKLRDSSDYTCVKDYNLIAFDLRSDAAKIKSIVEDFGLFAFTDDGKCLYSESLMRRMDEKDRVSELRRMAASKRYKKDLGQKRINSDANAGQVQSKSTANAEQNDAKESKEKERKENIKESFDKDSLSDGNPTRISSEDSENLSDHSVNAQDTTPRVPGAPPPGENINYRDLVLFFNNETKGVFGRISYPLSGKRQSSVRARVREYGKEAFANMVRAAARSDFLKGGNKTGFTATFDWLIRPGNFQKVLDGNYENRDKGGGTAPSDDERLMQNIAAGYERGLKEREERDL